MGYDVFILSDDAEGLWYCPVPRWYVWCAFLEEAMLKHV